MSGLRLRGLRAERGGFRLGPIDLDLPAGGHLALIGPSGAGKSTLLASLAGSVPARGEAWLGETELLALPPERRRIGWVPQGGLLFPHLRVEENVAFGVEPGERRCRVAEALAAVGALHLAGRKPCTLSGGETMRVALARALAVRPALLLLDEPLASLDSPARAELRILLASLPERLAGAPILHVTHDLDEARELATEAALLAGGTLVAAGPAFGLLAASPAAASLPLPGHPLPGEGVRAIR